MKNRIVWWTVGYVNDGWSTATAAAAATTTTTATTKLIYKRIPAPTSRYNA